MLLIEQFAHVALSLAKAAYVLEGGRVRYSGSAAELIERPELLQQLVERHQAKDATARGTAMQELKSMIPLRAPS